MSSTDEIFVEQENSNRQSHMDQLRVEHEFTEERHIPLKRLNTLPEGLENVAFEENEEIHKTLQEKSKDNEETRKSSQSSVSANSNKNNIRPIGHNPIYTQEDMTSKRFQRKQHGTLDVWWLFDDGGE